MLPGEGKDPSDWVDLERLHLGGNIGVTLQSMGGTWNPTKLSGIGGHF